MQRALQKLLSYVGRFARRERVHVGWHGILLRLLTLEAQSGTAGVPLRSGPDPASGGGLGGSVPGGG